MKKQQLTGNKKVLCFFCSLLFFILILNSCSTEKNSVVNKAFHYTTTKFNGFFHGKEALKLAKKNLDKNHVDNYQEILNIYREGSKEQAIAEYPNLDRAIAKAKKMVEKHSMKFKQKGVLVEANKMIDDCYFLLGQSRFYKMQYDSTIQTYKYILNHFKKSKLYYPVNFELIKTYIQQENFVDAETKIKFLEEDKDFPKKYAANFLVIKSHYFLKTKNHKEAIASLEMAIKKVKNSKLKNRLSYILAQLYDKEKNHQRASELFASVAKKALTYEMEFNAKLNLALSSHDKEKGKVLSDLNAMLKDKKNKEFQDQIYFVLAKVYEKNGDMDNAISCYKKSAKASVNNPKQKAESYLAIAEYYFSKTNYIDAQAFYDSSLVDLPKTHANYANILIKAESLSDLVKHINVVKTEDSLQRVASMSELDRQKLIEQKIKNLELEEDKKVQEEKAKLEQIKAAALTQSKSTGWIFDNSTLLASANAEFINLYGNRKLEDNWRRSNKATVVSSDVQDVSGKLSSDNSNDLIAENKTSEYYLKDLPFTEDAVKSSNEKIKKALYETAIIFKDKLNDTKKSNEYFEELNKRFPDGENRAVALYQLYRNYNKANELEKAEVNKNLILSEFPNSEYAQLIANPNKGAEEEVLKMELGARYQKIVELYKNGDYQSVLSEIQGLNQQYQNNPLKSNFELLHAFAIGKTEGKANFEIALKQVLADYAGTEVAKDVQIILDQIEAERMTQAGVQNQQKNEEKSFVFNTEEGQYFAIIFSPERVNVNELNQRISLFKVQNFAHDSLEIKIQEWGEKEKCLVISTFKKIKNAQIFESQLQQEILSEVANLGDLYFIISPSNFQKLLQYKEVEKYLKFYKENYQ